MPFWVSSPLGETAISMSGFKLITLSHFAFLLLETFKYSPVLSFFMAEIVVKVNVPGEELKKRFELALAKIMKSLLRELELSVAKEIVSKSKFTEQDADEIANKVKSSMHLQLINKGLV